MARELIQKNVTLSGDVRTAAARAAAESESSLNDIYVSILADHFRVRFDGTGRRSRGAQKTETGPVILWVPRRLAEKLDIATTRQPTGQRSLGAVIEPILREHFARFADAA